MIHYNLSTNKATTTEAHFNLLYRQGLQIGDNFYTFSYGYVKACIYEDVKMADTLP